MSDLNLSVDADFDRMKPKFEPGRPREISFYATYTSANGQQINLAMHVRVENGDVYGMLDVVAESGGIGVEGDDGVYRFIPWPCAAIEVRNVEQL